MQDLENGRPNCT